MATLMWTPGLPGVPCADGGFLTAVAFLPGSRGLVALPAAGEGVALPAAGERDRAGERTGELAA